MKHVVTLTTSNPGHEFVSLRRRQSTTNFMVEAADEQTAILRATAHFRRLGHYIHEAKIDKKKSLNENPLLIGRVAGLGRIAGLSRFPRASLTPVPVSSIPELIPGSPSALTTPYRVASGASKLNIAQKARSGVLKRAARTAFIASIGNDDKDAQQKEYKSDTLGQWWEPEKIPLYRHFGGKQKDLLSANVDELDENVDPQKSDMMRAISRVLQKRKDKDETKKNPNKINMEPKLISNSMPGAKL